MFLHFACMSYFLHARLHVSTHTHTHTHTHTPVNEKKGSGTGIGTFTPIWPTSISCWNFLAAAPLNKKNEKSKISKKK